MIVAFVSAAEAELDEAMAYYAGKSAAVASRFREAIEDAVVRIGERPDAWHPMGRGIRRYRLSRFPYGLIYRRVGDCVTIYAVMHLKRHPRYW